MAMKKPERLNHCDLYMQATRMLTSDDATVRVAGRRLLERIVSADPSWRTDVDAVLAACPKKASE